MALHNDFLVQLKKRIQADMHNKFGLSEEEADQSSTLLFSHISNFSTKDFLKENKDQLLAKLPDFNTIKNSATFEKFSSAFKNDLITKIGLSPDTADRIKEFSIEQLVTSFKTRI